MSSSSSSSFEIVPAAIVVCSGSEQTPSVGVPHRRSANYQPNTWDYDSICSSLHHHYSFHANNNKVEQPKASKEIIGWVQLQEMLKDRVRQQLQLLKEDDEDHTPAARLKLIDQLQSLGVAYHFEEEIKSILISISTHHQLKLKDDLSSTALLFRMLRGHGLPASADMLSAFIGGDDNKRDVDGLISLYEASYLAFPGETILNEARAFSMESLKESMEEEEEPRQRERIEGVLSGLPLHWRAPRLQALWSLKQQQQHQHDDKGDLIVQQLAAVDFNLVQSVHRGELERMTRWWKETGLGEKRLPFARDRMVECFFCAVCIAPEPGMEDCREILTKVSSLIVVLDDIYDVYGTLHELQVFTHAIGRWSSSSSSSKDGEEEALPKYMKAIYSAIVATSVSAADDDAQQRHYSLLPLYKKAWQELCKAFLVEATWQQEGYRPGFEEYLNNGWITSTGPLLLLHAFPTLIKHTSTSTAAPANFSWLDSNNGIVYPKLVELSSRIFRLCNDCATHKAESERGDAPSAIACCMMEKQHASEEQARADVRDAIVQTWKELNLEAAEEEMMSMSMSMSTSMCSLNLARTIHCIYHDGDTITDPTHQRKQLIKDMLFTPCHLF